MSKDVTGQPWVFDATAQAEGVGNGGVNTQPIYIDFVLCTSNGTAGAFTATDASGGRALFDVTTSSTTGTVVVPIGKYVDGIYLSALPSGGKVYIFHGQQA